LKKHHELSTEIERFVAEHNMAAHAALLQIYNARLEKITYQVGGKTLRQDDIMSILTGVKDESIRKEAALALSHGLGSEQELFATILDALVQDKRKMDLWRRYSNPSNDRHLENQIEPEVIGTLITSVRASYVDLSHRYYALKAKWLNKTQLDPWDRIAPLPFSNNTVIPFTMAKQMVLGAYRSFSPLLAEYLEDAFRQDLIDVPSVPGKTSGAFSHPTTLGIPSYMLINYLGQPRNVVTLAHEGGHYVHQVLSKNAQPPLLAQTPLTLSETASVFGEMLTFKSLQAQETDLEKRMAMTAEKVERMLNTVIRQVAFYDFECRVHEKGKDAPLTSDVINEIWQTTMAESHGPALRQDKLYDPYWCYVHHFFESPFYVYAYAFGDCLVNSLYGVYESEKAEGRGEDFAQKYIDLLKAGGSKTYNDLLAPFGLDAKDPGFWKRGLDVIGRFIDELELLDIERTAHPDQRKGGVKASTAAHIDKLLLG
jgi:oligoendopeptidase F